MPDVVLREDFPGFGVMRPIVEAVTREYKMTEAALIAPGKSRTPVEARYVCAWLAEKLNIRLAPAEVGEVLGRNKNTMARAVVIIEAQRREDNWLREMTDRLLVELRGVDA